MKFAAIDIGTNAARLLIGEVRMTNLGLQIQKLGYYRSPLRLGDEVFSKGKISASKLKQFIQTMQAFQLLATAHQVTALRAVATSAMREASNNKKVAKEILQQTGLQIEVISGEEEAQLIFNAFELLHLGRQAQYIVVDVGGGSTEISVFEEGKRRASQSFELGTLRLLNQKVAPNIWDSFKNWIQTHAKVNEAHIVFGTGGNINRALKMLPNKSAKISLKDLVQLHGKLSPLTLNERIEQFQLKADRADVIVPALEIYIAALSALAQPEIVVPKIGLADGILLELYLKNTPL
jgi:exopolyphosphatase/guanosine-5'-triphosphate,3'-diphosphate pyrophosphatase